MRKKESPKDQKNQSRVREELLGKHWEKEEGTLTAHVPFYLNFSGTSQIGTLRTVKRLEFPLHS